MLWFNTLHFVVTGQCIGVLYPHLTSDLIPLSHFDSCKRVWNTPCLSSDSLLMLQFLPSCSHGRKKMKKRSEMHCLSSWAALKLRHFRPSYYSHMSWPHSGLFTAYNVNRSIVSTQWASKYLPNAQSMLYQLRSCRCSFLAFLLFLLLFDNDGNRKTEKSPEWHLNSVCCVKIRD